MNNSKPKILLIEDDVNLGFLIEKFIINSGYPLTRVKSGLEGLSESSKNRYSLFLIDIGLPDISGFDVIENIRQYDSITPIIVITDNIEQKNVVKSFEKRATLFHPKPIDFVLLIAQINSYLSKTEVHNTVKIENFIFNKSERTISNGSITFTLSRSEYNLINLFTHNDCKLYTRAELLSKIMNRTRALSDSAIDTLISRVRKKLEYLGYENLIVTVHNCGYKINPVYENQIKRL